MKPPYINELNAFARQLRKNATRHENHLWYDYLRTYSVSFRRQRPIAEYIADFYCERAALVIELDGSQHYEDADRRYDEKRSEKLRSLGIEVLRFSNADIDKNFEGVCMKIDEAVMLRIQHPSESIPEWER